MNNSINNRIKELRINTKLSQDSFAKSIGTNRPNYSQIEMGKQKPTLEILSKIHKVYGVPYESLIDGFIGKIGTEVSDKLMDAYGINKFPCNECEKMKEDINFDYPALLFWLASFDIQRDSSFAQSKLKA